MGCNSAVGVSSAVSDDIGRKSGKTFNAWAQLFNARATSQDV